MILMLSCLCCGSEVGAEAFCVNCASASAVDRACDFKNAEGDERRFWKAKGVAMSIEYELQHRLVEDGIQYTMIYHPKSFTAVETAELDDVPKSIYAKAVIVKVGNIDTMFIIPANRRVDPLKVAAELKLHDVRVEEETEVESMLGPSAKGAMVPIGELYGLPAYLDVVFLKQKHVVFSAGNHEESIKMGMRDFLVIANATIGDYSVPAQVLAVK